MTKAGQVILVVDGETHIRQLLSMALGQAGYQVESAMGGLDALRKATEGRPDAVILDVRLPDVDGWETCRRIRDVSDVPIMILTTMAGVANEIRGFSCGADQYVTKPFSLPVLMARLSAMLRRAATSGRTSDSSFACVGDLQLDLAAGQVIRNGETLDLTPTEFRLLSALASKPGQVVCHKDLLTQVWGPEYAGEHGYLKLYVRYLRQKLESDPAHPQYILTRRGHGYSLACGPPAMALGNGAPGPGPAGSIEQRMVA